MKTKQKSGMVVVLASILLILGLASPVLGHIGDDDSSHHGMMGGFYGSSGMGLFGWVFMILIIVALVLFIIWIFKQIQK